MCFRESDGGIENDQHILWYFNKRWYIIAERQDYRNYAIMTIQFMLLYKGQVLL